MNNQISNPNKICTNCKNLNVYYNIIRDKLVLYCEYKLWWPKESCKKKIVMNNKEIYEQIIKFKHSIWLAKKSRGEL